MQDQESGATVKEGESQDLAKKENWEAAKEEKCSKLQKKRVFEAAGMKSQLQYKGVNNIISILAPLKKKYFFQRPSSCPSLFSAVWSSILYLHSSTTTLKADLNLKKVILGPKRRLYR